MSLEHYARNGWIAQEPTSADEIRRLLAIADRGIADAKVTAISADLRLVAAFSSALAAATAALRAEGYRTKTQVGHHMRVMECLDFTIGADSKLQNKLKTISKKRNATTYDAAGNVSDAELKLAIGVAEELRGRVADWLAQAHPELL